MRQGRGYAEARRRRHVRGGGFATQRQHVTAVREPLRRSWARAEARAGGRSRPRRRWAARRICAGEARAGAALLARRGRGRGVAGWRAGRNCRGGPCDAGRQHRTVRVHVRMKSRRGSHYPAGQSRCTARARQRIGGARATRSASTATAAAHARMRTVTYPPMHLHRRMPPRVPSSLAHRASA